MPIGLIGCLGPAPAGAPGRAMVGGEVADDTGDGRAGPPAPAPEFNGRAGTRPGEGLAGVGLLLGAAAGAGSCTGTGAVDAVFTVSDEVDIWAVSASASLGSEGVDGWVGDWVEVGDEEPFTSPLTPSLAASPSPLGLSERLSLSRGGRVVIMLTT